MASRAIPESAISAFHLDSEGHWVAELACGHAQHMRHRPPFENRDWVVTEEGRTGRVGALVPCRMCLMPKLPAGVAEYKRTADFDAASVPAALLRSHQLKAGAWGEIVVTAGHVLYVIELAGDATGGDATEAFPLRPGLTGVIAPEAPHHVELGEGGRFYVRFLG